MMSPLPIERAAAQKATVTLPFGLTHQAWEGFAKLVAQNLDVAKSALRETQDAMRYQCA